MSSIILLGWFNAIYNIFFLINLHFLALLIGEIVGNKARGRIWKRVFQENKARQIFRKTNISYPPIRTRTFAYQGVRNVRFSENLGCFAFLKHFFWDSPFCRMTEENCCFNSGNIIGSDNVWIDINRIISTENVLLSLNNFLLTNKRYLIKECLWLLANIFARRELSITDNLKEIQVIISNVKRHLNSAYEIKKEVRRDLL